MGMTELGKTARMKKIKVFREFGVFMVMVSLIAILSIASPAFLQMTNLINIVRQTVEIGIMAIGMTFIIVSAEIDLSAGSAYGATAMLAAYLYKAGVNPTLVFSIAMLAGGAIGFVNGFLITKAKMPAFIVTLGTMQIFRSIAYSISGGQNISVFPESAESSWIFKLGGSIGVIPIQVIVMIAFFIIAHMVMSKTKFGFEVYATGGNKRAAQLAGINTDRIKIACMVIAGVLYAFASQVSIAYLKSVPTTAGASREMDAIAAVILGGAALSGGRGTVIGTLIGAIIMSVVKNGMVLLSVPVFWQSGFIGVIIILAVLLDTCISRSNKKG
ncbi:ABC transporter permease [Alkalibaculum bacchi]|uniref:ABC transporter permease n=1 Tax=Alkalibaculum bacchi TaxID=645887 RepID=UPI0026EB9677|nr:ABC transporter permease [Alkalibaculum bacchi]